MPRFLKSLKRKNAKPRYIAIAAMTLDGKIARDHHHFSDWTSPEDKAFMRRILATCDVVVVGRNTYETAKKPLSKRNCMVLTHRTKQSNSEPGKLVFVNPEKTNLNKLITRLGYRRVAILGGTQTYTHFLKHRLLDELYLTIEPVIFGRGLPLFEGKFETQRLRLISTKKLNRTGSLLLHYTR